MAKRTCSIDGCERPMSTRGWCGTHYQRWRAHGTVELLPAPLRTCRVEGCDRSFYGRDLCKLHYDRHRLHGSTDVPSRRAAPPQPLCGVEGCDSVSVVRSREMCDKHYTRWKRYGNPLEVRHHFDFVACLVEDCGAKMFAHGWCRLHYKRWKAHGDPEIVLGGAGEDHPGWSGDAVGYFGMHARLRAQRGKPDRCEHCGRNDGEGMYQWALIWDRATIVTTAKGLIYSTSLNDYMRLCVRCHKRYDKRRPRVDHQGVAS